MKEFRIEKCQDCGIDFNTSLAQATLCSKCWRKASRTEGMQIVLDGKTIQGNSHETNKPENGRRVLTEANKAKVAYMLAMFTPMHEISKYFTKELGVKLNPGSIASIRDSERWGIVIKNIRKEWLNKVGEVPISNKRVRLEAYQKMMEKGFDEENMNVVKSALSGAREEMENKIGGGNNYSLTYVQTLSDQDLINKRSEILEKLKRIKLEAPKEKGEEKDIADAEFVTEDELEVSDAEGIGEKTKE